MSIWKRLGFTKLVGADDAPDEEAAKTQAVREIVAELDALDREHARLIAAFSYILSRVAYADLDISEEETLAMERILVEWGHLPREQALIVVQMAKSHSVLFGGTEDYLVTREFAQMADEAQKTDLLHCLFAVAAADRSISSAEDDEIRRIATQLGFTHKQFIEVRLLHKDYLDVLKKPDGAAD